MRQERFELPTFGSVDRRSIQLSYWRRTTKFSGRAAEQLPGREGAHAVREPQNLERTKVLDLSRPI
jgi:hypothetical protein